LECIGIERALLDWTLEMSLLLENFELEPVMFSGIIFLLLLKQLNAYCLM